MYSPSLRDEIADYFLSPGGGKPEVGLGIVNLLVGLWSIASSFGTPALEFDLLFGGGLVCLFAALAAFAGNRPAGRIIAVVAYVLLVWDFYRILHSWQQYSS